MRPLIITLDGPAGSGKSAVAHQLAKRLGLNFLDTGSMYRGLTAECLDRGLNPLLQFEAVANVARQVSMRFDWQHDPPRLHVAGTDITDRLRDPDVTERVSTVAAIGSVRQILVEHQKKIGRDHPRLVTEGRDQGSIVFPNAQVKFYIDASSPIRARRRALQLRKLGQHVDEQEILEQLTQRDHRDSNRKDGPLICPDDAERIDTTDMSLDEVVEELVVRVRRRIGHLPSIQISNQPSTNGGQG